MRWLLLLVLPSCDVVFGLKEIERGPVDAALDAPANCTDEYVELSGKKYRFITVLRSFTAHRIDCRDDVLGSTHLAVMTTRLEAEIVKENLPPPIELYFVGALQLPTADERNEGWLWVSKEPFDHQVWATNEPTEDGMENHAAVSAMTYGIIDLRADTPSGAVCECDGKPDMGEPWT